jgi:4-amino-4-deoxy-L-arabinose transferase-like glycosyltransferase
MSDVVSPGDVGGAEREPLVAVSVAAPVPGTSYVELRTFSLLLLFALPVFVIYLGANSIWDANEAFYVDTPRQMVVTGDYITPYFNGTQRLNKPVLSYWIVAALYQLFGVSVAVERVGIAAGALGIVGATFLIGRALHSTLVGVLAALMIATAPRMVMFSRRIFIDIYITMFMAVALACLLWALRSTHHRRRWLAGMYVAIGLGVLTKGPVALVLPAAACAVWMVIERRWSELRRLMLPEGALIVFAIVAPWYIALYAEYGWDPIRQFFIGENLDRYTSAMVPGTRGPLFYLPVLFSDLFPWAPLLLVPILSAWRSRREGEGAGHASIRRLLWTWIVVIVGVFSLSQTKQDLYIFPVVPAVAALVADALVTTRFGLTDRRLRVILAVVAFLTMMVGVLGYWLFNAGYYRLDGIGVVAVVLVGGSAATGIFLWRGRPMHALAALAAAYVLFNYVFVGRVLPGTERLKPSVPLAAVLAEQAGEHGRLGAYHLLFPSLVYYVGRPIHEIASVEEAQAFYAGAADGAWVIMSPDNYETLREAIPGLCIVDRRPLFEAKLGDIVSRQPASDVLLVTNRCQEPVPDRYGSTMENNPTN